MDDVGLFALAENSLRFVDERWGRPFAWALALVMLVLPISAVTYLLFW